MENRPLTNERASGLIAYRAGVPGITMCKIVAVVASIFCGVWLSLLARSAFVINDRTINKGTYTGLAALMWSIVVLTIRSIFDDRRVINLPTALLLPSDVMGS